MHNYVDTTENITIVTSTLTHSEKHMNNKQLIAEIAQKTDLPLSKVQAVLEAQKEIITAELIAGQSVAIPGFVTYKAVDRAARVGINPKTQEKIQIAARKGVTVTPGKTLKDAVAGIKKDAAK
ncbi:HU family DNA-binding protein [Pseudomonas syringae pv. actinidiae]|nr:HU family DNA-binding protein [Pseudomonas syringae pv. actinidiae]